MDINIIKGFKKGVSFAEALQGETSTKVLEFIPKNIDINSLKKSYVGEVITLGTTFHMQAKFSAEGFFLVKFTPLGAYLCLLEDDEDAVLKDLVEIEKLLAWAVFKEVRIWSLREIDRERFTWVKVCGISC